MSKSSATRPATVTPKFAIGQCVRYVDHHNRPQDGEVLHIEATWHERGNPLVLYTVRHPSYRNRRHYAAEYDVTGLAALTTERGRDR